MKIIVVVFYELASKNTNEHYYARMQQLLISSVQFIAK
jgi:hypothetical protein